jgi:hypothetical protein
VLIAVASLIQLLGSLYPDGRYFSIEAFYEQRSVKPWWFGSIPLASIDFLTSMKMSSAQLNRPSGSDQLAIRRRAESAFAAMDSAESEVEFIHRMPNPANMELPNIVWLKFTALGLPAVTEIAYLMAPVTMICLGAFLLFRELRKVRGAITVGLLVHPSEPAA